MKIDEILNGVKVEWKQLGEICEIGTGKSNTNQQVENGDYPFYVRSKDIKKINHFDFNEEAVLIPGEGGVGEIFHYVKGKYALHQRVYRIFIKNDILKTKFLYYYMIAYFKDFILKNAVGSTVISIRKPMIENFQVPIPPLEIQEKIAKTLDKFTNYATELQTELQLRTKQYEYYRNLLLSKEFLENMCVKFDDKPCGGATRNKDVR